MYFKSSVENSVDPYQLASVKPADMAASSQPSLVACAKMARKSRELSQLRYLTKSRGQETHDLKL